MLPQVWNVHKQSLRGVLSEAGACVLLTVTCLVTYGALFGGSLLMAQQTLAFHLIVN